MATDNNHTVPENGAVSGCLLHGRIEPRNEKRRTSLFLIVRNDQNRYSNGVRSIFLTR